MPDSDVTDISDKFLKHFIPFAKIINISDLLFLNGIKMSVYYKSLRLFHNMYMKLRKSKLFTNIFNFYVKVPRYTNGVESHGIITNPDPLLLISFILTTLKEYLSIRLTEDFELP